MSAHDCGHGHAIDSRKLSNPYVSSAPVAAAFFPFWYHVPHHHHRHPSYPQTNTFFWIEKKKNPTEEERWNGEKGNSGRALRLPEFGHCTGGTTFARSVESFISIIRYHTVRYSSTIWYSSYDIIHRAKTTPEKFAEQKEKKGKKKKGICPPRLRPLPTPHRMNWSRQEKKQESKVKARKKERKRGWMDRKHGNYYEKGPHPRQSEKKRMSWEGEWKERMKRMKEWKDESKGGRQWMDTWMSQYCRPAPGGRPKKKATTTERKGSRCDVNHFVRIRVPVCKVWYRMCERYLPLLTVE